MRMFSVSSIVAAIMVGQGTACAESEISRGRAVFPDGTRVAVEVVDTEATRQRGLMFRTSLAPTEGMIFVFDRDEHLNFWMKNTPTALSIAFLSAEGKILEIEDMEPYSEKIVQSRLSARYALEMRQGAFADLGIMEGMVIDLPPDFPAGR